MSWLWHPISFVSVVFVSFHSCCKLTEKPGCAVLALELQEFISEHVFRCLILTPPVLLLQHLHNPALQMDNALRNQAFNDCCMWICACKMGKAGLSVWKQMPQPTETSSDMSQLEAAERSFNKEAMQFSWSSSCPRLRPIQNKLRRMLPTRMPLMAMQVLRYTSAHKSCLQFCTYIQVYYVQLSL